MIGLSIAVADPSGEGAKAGPWGLATILVLCVACYFLFKSMSKHLRKVREEFPSDDPPTGPSTGPSVAAKPAGEGTEPAPAQPADGSPAAKATPSSRAVAAPRASTDRTDSAE
ncbi:MAG: hypothetical protein ABI301_07300 [Jatrophihabitantaceae bacterium]